jgi:hypothetical protein
MESGFSPDSACEGPMKENNYGHHGNEKPPPDSVHQDADHEQSPYWKRTHHDWRGSGNLARG